MIGKTGVAAGSSSESNLVVESLSKAFGGVRALDEVSFEVYSGEIHGLLGQNGSGKSTLIKILGGVYAPDQGRIWTAGRELQLPLRPGEFSDYGIAIVHQALGLVPSLSVVENLFVRRLVRSRRLWIDWSKARRQAAVLFNSYGLALKPDWLVADLAPVERALLAIVRAFHEISESGKAQRGLLILDEPTPFLSGADVERLFALVRSLAARGASVIFVSHDVDEVAELTDRATVLRNGRVAASLITKSTSKAEFISAIVGRHLDLAIAAPREFSGPPSVRVIGLAGAGLEAVDLYINPGEIVGLTGLIGSGFSRVPYLLYGAEKSTAGTLSFGGSEVDLTGMAPERALELGMSLIPADRQNAGVAESLSIAENLSLPLLGRTINGWWITDKEVYDHAADVVLRFDVRPRDPSRPVRTLSGGNQQKVLLGKWLQTEPSLVLLDEPTQGVDVGAREQVYKIIRAAATRGTSVLCASSDHEQLAAISDRVLVFSRGRIVASLKGKHVTKEAITDSCFRSMEGQLALSSDAVL